MEICWKKWIHQKRKVICYFTYCETAWEFFLTQLQALKPSWNLKFDMLAFCVLKKREREGGTKEKLFVQNIYFL